VAFVTYEKRKGRWHLERRRRTKWHWLLFVQLRHQMIIQPILRNPCLAGGVPREFSRFGVQFDAARQWRAQQLTRHEQARPVQFLVNHWQCKRSQSLELDRSTTETSEDGSGDRRLERVSWFRKCSFNVVAKVIIVLDREGSDAITMPCFSTYCYE